jgi:integrase/recombinase XerD
MENTIDFWQARKDFLHHLRYTRGHGERTCYFAKAPGDKAPSPWAVRAYLRRLIERSGIDKKVTPHKLRHTYATRLLESGAELVDIQVLLHCEMADSLSPTERSERMARIRAKDSGPVRRAVAV